MYMRATRVKKRRRLTLYYTRYISEQWASFSAAASYYSRINPRIWLVLLPPFLEYCVYIRMRCALACIIMCVCVFFFRHYFYFVGHVQGVWASISQSSLSLIRCVSVCVRECFIYTRAVLLDWAESVNNCSLFLAPLYIIWRAFVKRQHRIWPFYKHIVYKMRLFCASRRGVFFFWFVFGSTLRQNEWIYNKCKMFFFFKLKKK